MYRPASRSLITRTFPSIRSSARQRFLSTAPPSQKPRSWKSSAIRWGFAAGGIYYYNTSNVFAEEPAYSIVESTPQTDESSLPTLESISASRNPKKPSSPATTSVPPPPPPNSDAVTPDAAPTTPPTDPPRTPEEYEEEAGQQGAFNEETGEINWDCPCLGGMAHGPCGEEFRAAFSCFVFSKEEPKGMDCIENFKGMQDCFRRHPENYGSELADDEDDGEEVVDPSTTPSTNQETRADTSPPSSQTQPLPLASEETSTTQTQRAKSATEQVSQDHSVQDESEDLVPKAAHDATSANDTEK